MAATAWPTVTQPKDLGGLGVPDLEKFGRALRLRWLWQEWVDESKPWAGSQLPCNEADRLLFDLSTMVTIGDGAKTRFWHNNWLEGVAPRNLAPHFVPPSHQKKQDGTTGASKQKLDTLTKGKDHHCYPYRRVRLSMDQNSKCTAAPRCT